MNNSGFGDKNFTFAVYIANKPNMLEYQGLNKVTALVKGEINIINQACGNGWRKIFNVYAKLVYSLDKEYFCFSNSLSTWQDYRDEYLLQMQSKTALLFSAPQLSPNNKILHIICGKGYAKILISSGKLNSNLVWLDDEFAIDSLNNLIVCPYFDYRQLSNIKIERLAGLLRSLKMVEKT
ncbi:DUF6942 family protein [Colwellia psychrerythraea]|uniref:Uncharacterized protein n=1 Tax=Colwellia psychrerythraea TaxID=28229 RepID=A0A099KJZ2_COLPS|nr:hypothetical protein [Colwellia psychrerythraea]KGJ89918.1 hypothetical protein GAB14E_3796 [Colwellia psychrerythraea]